MLLTIGTHRVPTTDGGIDVRGRRQIVLEWGVARRDLLLTMDLFSNDGRHIARLRRNEWTFNDKNRFDLASSVKGFTLTDTESNQVVLQAAVVGRDEVAITNGVFRSSAGEHIEILRQADAGLASLS